MVELAATIFVGIVVLMVGGLVFAGAVFLFTQAQDDARMNRRWREIAAENRKRLAAEKRAAH